MAAERSDRAHRLARDGSRDGRRAREAPRVSDDDRGRHVLALGGLGERPQVGPDPEAAGIAIKIAPISRQIWDASIG